MSKGQGLDKKKDPISVKDLLESGAHFGHQRRRWNPKMKRFIFGTRNGLYIIDLAKTMQQLRKCLDVIDTVVGKGQSILFVGTKKAAKDVVRTCAEESGQYYVSERWLGGMLTNMSTIRQSIKRLEKVEKRLATGGEGLTKKELGLLTKDQEKLERNLSGIRSMRKLPGLLIVVDPGHEHIAVAEARKLGIPVMGLVDTNCDPDPIDYVIPCNDDALKSVQLIVSTLAQAATDKYNAMQVRRQTDKAEAMPEEKKS